MELGKKIKELRCKRNLTQNELSEKLFVSYQAVSQWENGTTNPDISVLPKLASVFEVSIDELFSLEKPEERNELDGGKTHVNILNVEDDTLYILLLKGSEIKDIIDYDKYTKEKSNLVVEYMADITNIKSHFNINVEGNVLNNANAGVSIECNDIGNNANAGYSIDCNNVKGSVSAGSTVDANNITGNVSAGSNIDCNDISGNVASGNKVEAHIIHGDVKADTVITQE